MDERGVILDELRRAWDGDPWHGDSVRAILGRVAAERASARAIPGAHTPLEIVLHMTSWTREATRRLRTGTCADPADGDWPPAGDAEWGAAVDALSAAHAELLREVEAFPPGRLHDVVGDARDRPLGSGVSYCVLLHGIAQHHAYHAGQIALLAKG
ncbi:MAG TPA: DinB family protein [Longimicrobium sp.]|nr:DinB family protein [Longimicrobium sp.]